MSAFPQTGRDADTFGPIIVPSSFDDESRDDEPKPLASKWMGLAVAMGVIVGTLLVGYVYVLDQRDIQTTARMAANAPAIATPAKGSGAKALVPAAHVAPPVAAPEAPVVPASPAAAPASTDALGFIAIPGPAGSRVFEGSTLVGIAPMMHVTTVGSHVIRVRPAGSGAVQSFDVHVRAAETSAIVVADTGVASGGRAKRPSRGVRASAR